MSNSVIDLGKAQEQQIEDRRREYERVLFENMLGCYTLVEKKGLKSVKMMDISRSGCKFRVLQSDGVFQTGEELSFRFYFSQDTYLPAFITLKRRDKVYDNGMEYFEYGAEFDKKVQSYDALKKFIDFIYKYAEHAKKDSGDKQIWFL